MIILTPRVAERGSRRAEPTAPIIPPAQVREAVTVVEGDAVVPIPAPGQTFQVREAVTVGAAPGENEAGPSQTFQVRDAVTIREGRRRGKAAPGPEQTFQVREAVTVVEGDAVVPIPAPGQTFQVREAVTVGAAPGEHEAGPSQTFQVREAVTVEQRPPHWAAALPPGNEEKWLEPAWPLLLLRTKN